jgi:hypothetical protein
MKSVSVAVLVCLGVLAVGVSAQARGQSPLYYGTQIGGGTIAALAGGVAGTLAGGLGGVLLALPIEFTRNPKGVYQITQERQIQSPEDLLAPSSEEPLPLQWGFRGAKIGFGLGVSVGAAMGVIWIGKLFGVEGDPQGAFTGAFAGGLVGMLLLTEPQKYPFSFQGWYCKRIEEPEKNKTSWECGYQSASMEPIEILLSPMALAALGATIGYNAKVGLAISATVVNVRF